MKKKKERIINTTNFDNLRNMEKQGLFNENAFNKLSTEKINFFHQGP